MNSIIKYICLVLIRTYQTFFSPVLNSMCRFQPTCSEYAYQAISRHGVLRGGFLATKRLLKCHPFHPGGFDPVP